MEKNEIYEIYIEDMSEDGAGIGHIDGMAIFVKDAAVGDRAEVRIVKAKKNYAFGRLEKIIEPSPDRVQPICPVARQCGGCTLQHISYEKELELKKSRVMNCLKRIGGIESPEDYLEGVFGNEVKDVSGPARYRNKMQFPIGRDKDGKTVMGFYAGRTHSLIPMDDCIIGHAVNKYLCKAVCDWADKYKVLAYDEKTGKGVLRHMLTRIGFKTGELMVCMVVNCKKLAFADELVEALRRAVDEYNEAVPSVDSKGNKLENNPIVLTSVVMNINTDNTNKILGDKTKLISGQDYITDYIGDIKFQISAQSFYQVNPYQTERLYGKALEYAGLSGGEAVWDMYCGIGTISLFLSQKARKVYGVEIVPQAIEDAKLNARINDIDNAEFFVGKAEDVVTKIYADDNTKFEIPDVIVVDPPRKGCDEKLLETLVKLAPKTLVYVSCDPSTLARDLKYLLAEGFKLEKVSVYDQFSRSMHVETVVLLSKVYK